MSVLVDLTFETSLGAKYIFPDMEKRDVDELVAMMPRPKDIVLVNASGACLTVPSRIITLLFVDGEERWRRSPA